jgi:hypothetical protein
VVAIEAEVVAVTGRQQRGVLVGDDAQPVPRQVEVAHDLGAQQTADVGAGRIEEVRMALLRNRRAADRQPAFQHRHLQPRPGKIGRRGQAVVSGPDHDDVAPVHRWFSVRAHGTQRYDIGRPVARKIECTFNQRNVAQGSRFMLISQPCSMP